MTLWVLTFWTSLLESPVKLYWGLGISSFLGLLVFWFIHKATKGNNRTAKEDEVLKDSALSLSEAELEAYTGHYRNLLLDRQINVERVGNQLGFRDETGVRYFGIPTADKQFELRGTHQSVNFTTTDNVVNKLNWDKFGSLTVHHKVN
jgi:hypothetical protein